MYYRGAHAAILVLDVGAEGSFESVKAWIKELMRSVPSRIGASARILRPSLCSVRPSV